MSDSIYSDNLEPLTPLYKISTNFLKIKDNLNICIHEVNCSIADANMLALAAEEGKLSIRADTEKHQGDFKRIIKGVNNTLDAFIGPVKESVSVLNEIAKVTLHRSKTPLTIRLIPCRAT